MATTIGETAVGPGEERHEAGGPEVEVGAEEWEETTIDSLIVAAGEGAEPAIVEVEVIQRRVRAEIVTMETRGKTDSK